MIPKTTLMVVVAVVMVALQKSDGRSSRSSRKQRYTYVNATWKQVLKSAESGGWFTQTLRMERSYFEAIVLRVERRWLEKFEPLGPNVTWDIQDRVAVAIHYYTHSSNLATTGAVFGISKTSVHRYVWQVTTIILLYQSETIALPDNNDKWRVISDGFETIAGVPGVLGAIDGTLFEIERGNDFEGYYCRKGFPSFNVQAIADHQKRFIQVSIFPGSYSDKSIFNATALRNVQSLNLPVDCHFLGDAGYQLMGHVMIPYEIRPSMPDDESNYNYQHSRTRIKVEQAFGLYKGKFRMFKRPLDLKTKAFMSKIIIATMILHNWLIDFGSYNSVNAVIEPWMHIGDDDAGEQTQQSLLVTQEAIQKRNTLKEYLQNV
jgi:hypothetical protein